MNYKVQGPEAKRLHVYRAPNLGCRIVGVESAVNLFPKTGECKVPRNTQYFEVFHFEVHVFGVQIRRKKSVSQNTQYFKVKMQIPFFQITLSVFLEINISYSAFTALQRGFGVWSSVYPFWSEAAVRDPVSACH